MIFLLSDREKNCRILCSQCSNQKYDLEHDVYRCMRMVRCELTHNTYSYVRLAMLSRSGGECQLFKPRAVME